VETSEYNFSPAALQSVISEILAAKTSHPHREHVTSEAVACPICALVVRMRQDPALKKEVQQFTDSLLVALNPFTLLTGVPDDDRLIILLALIVGIKLGRRLAAEDILNSFPSQEK
jgi:hypothetical protein